MKRLDYFAKEWYGNALAVCGYALIGVAFMCMMASYVVRHLPSQIHLVEEEETA